MKAFTLLNDNLVDRLDRLAIYAYHDHSDTLATILQCLGVCRT